MKPSKGGNTVWTALAFALGLMVGTTPALAGGQGPDADLVLYEVTEDMVLLNSDGKPVQSLAQAVRRSARAALSGFAKLGTPLCPWEVLVLTPGAKSCTVNATGADDLSLADGKGTLGGTFAVVVQDPSRADAPEFVVMTGLFVGKADLSLPFRNVAPIGYLTQGHGCIDGYPCDLETAPVFKFMGTFRLPFGLDKRGAQVKPVRHRAAYYLGDDFRTLMQLGSNEKSLGWPTVRLEIKF